MADIRAVWTDFGGVLTPPIAETFAAFCTKMNVPGDPLLSAILKVTADYGTDDVMLPIDTPLVTEREWLAQIGAVLSAEHGINLELTTLADAWFGDRPVNQPWLDLLSSLRSTGLFVGMISNMVPTWDAHWRRMVDPDTAFDAVILSFEVGHRKPAPEIFELAVERSGVSPAESVFIDDLAKNCDAARAAGWRAIHFTDAETAISELTELVGPIKERQ
jgi:putative hydrolase of the HAD superfamily